MSKYNHYAVDFDAAFKKFRTAYCEAFNKLEAAKAAEKSASGEVARLTAKAKRIEAENNFKTVSADALRDFNRARDESTAALKAEVEAANVADPAALDRDACYLLDSGILKPSDYVSLAEKFNTNPTMRRLIAAKAGTAAETAEPADRVILNNVCHSCEAAAREPLEAWDTLVAASRYCSGQVSTDASASAPGHVVSMANRWEDFASEAVEAF